MKQIFSFDQQGEFSHRTNPILPQSIISLLVSKFFIKYNQSFDNVIRFSMIEGESGLKMRGETFRK
jgi:hypothetical protein